MAANPNPARITEASWWFMEQLLALHPGSRDGGIFADKSGYHNTRAANQRQWPNDYSIRDAEDRGGPGDKAAAYDWTFPDAQAGRYGSIAVYSQRLVYAGSVADPRLGGWREFFGQTDTDRGVEGWDFRYQRPSSADASHLWHIHFSEDRDKVESYDNKRAMLSVLRGESVKEWLGLTDPWEDDMPHVDLELGRTKVVTAPTVVGGVGWVCLSAAAGTAVVRVALKRVGNPTWEVRDNVVVAEAADHVSLVRIDGSVTKVSALVTSVTSPETAVSLDIVPNRPYS